MFPIRDHNPPGRVPYVNYALIAANVLIFFATLPLEGNQRALYALYESWAVVPARIVHGDALYTLASSMFLHGGWMHIIGNMLFLHVFGDNLEDQLGHLGYLAFYLACGVAAGLAQVAADPGSALPLIGASGAIAGVMGGYLLLFPKARIDILFIIIVFIRIIPVPAWFVLGFWFALQLFNGLSATAGAGGVAYWAHAGGFLIGAALMLPVFLARGGPRFWDRAGGRPPHAEASYRVVRTGIPAVRAKPRSLTQVPVTKGRPKR
ncbi:rhomboid family intramembrane serine protease [Mangrovicoccus sp. HB161399]|uniref:rhomboid family intramembrane serine protease n=1 Tax=Mangrovicoccus sp. HB161399 TaxID=2720392 RepID=UPI0015565B3E|nr:rhomboid family intramembrane serine protease [Mangrovicoccus sp. HB161399]